MQPDVINLGQKFALFDEHWSPRVIAGLNDYQIKLVKVKGEFVWHSHPETDEAFFVISGELVIELRDRVLTLGPGEMTVIPKGVEHRPVARDECHMMLIEPTGVMNTGGATSELTAANNVWI